MSLAEGADVQQAEGGNKPGRDRLAGLKRRMQTAEAQPRVKPGEQEGSVIICAASAWSSRADGGGGGQPGAHFSRGWRTF